MPPNVTLSINDNIKFLKKLKQVLEGIVSWTKCRSEMTRQPKKQRLRLNDSSSI